jgi:hypothetical protein
LKAFGILYFSTLEHKLGEAMTNTKRRENKTFIFGIRKKLILSKVAVKTSAKLEQWCVRIGQKEDYLYNVGAPPIDRKL